MHHSMTWLRRPAAPDSTDALIASFDQEWDQSEGLLAALWSRCRERSPLTVLSALIKVDLRHRFAQGQRPTAADYFARFPELTRDDDRALSLVYEEFCLLEESQDEPNVSEFCRRYQPWQDSIASQLGHHQCFSQIVATEKPRVRYPVVGERFATYELRSLLGQGGAAQVYLASQDDLGGRKVVLKLTPMMGLEPVILANLEHRNIIPILSIARSDESGLQGICMPYHPGITLDRVMGRLLEAQRPRRASALWNLLGVDRLDPQAVDLAWRDFPMEGTYTEAVAWLGREMAHALAYLHEQKVYHRDIKPANILLAIRGGPLLFDFNLAHSPHAPEHAQAALSGGTLPYMAPEQLQAFLDPEVWSEVGAAADIYALGLVLREMVTGAKPDLPRSDLPLNRAIAELYDRRPEYALSSREDRPDLPPSLDSIIRKCLAFRPGDRYATAHQLAQDLHQFLQRKPLTTAPNPSSFERGLNWAYRQRRVALSLSFMAIVLVFGVLINIHRSRVEPLTADVEVINPLFAEPFQPLAAPVDPQPIYDALRDPEFLHGITLLDSVNPRDWPTARRIFEDLTTRHQRSAWPLLFLAQALERLGESATAQQRVVQATSLADAELVMRHCLPRMPGSIPLLLKLGHIAANRRDYSTAEEYCQQVLKLRPDHSGALSELGRVYRLQKRTDESIRRYGQALESGVRTNQDPKHLAQLRQLFTSLVLGRVDELLQSPVTRDRMVQAGNLLVLARDQLAFLEQAEVQNLGEDPLYRQAFILTLCRGSLESSQAYLIGLGGAPNSTLPGFKLARTHLAEALEGARAFNDSQKPGTDQRSDDSVRSQDFVPYIQSLQAELARRVAACRATAAL